MENPRLTFNPEEDAPKFHDLDRAHAEAFNKGIEARKEYRLAEHLEPFPYIGNPLANTFFLLANPGVNENEASPDFRMNSMRVDQIGK